MDHDYCMEGERLVLRPLRETEIELVRKWRNQEWIRTSFIHQEYLTEQQQQAWFSRYLQKHDDLMFVIEDRETHHLIGAVAMYQINAESKEAEFGRLMIGDPSAAGRGFATEATRMLCQFGLATLGLQRIYLTVFPDNLSARRVYEKCGFVTIDVETVDEKTLLVMHWNKTGTDV